MPAPDYAFEIQKLESALGTGVLEVRLADGKMTRFADAADLKARLSYFKAEAAKHSAGLHGGCQTTYADFSGRC